MASRGVEGSRPRRIALVALLVVAGLAWVAPAGDEDVAKLLYQKGRKAARAKQWGEAEGHLRRALAEHSPYPEASFALAEILEKLDRPDEALAIYLDLKETLSASSVRKHKSMAKRAARSVARLNKAYADLAGRDRQFVQDGFTFVRKYGKSAPLWAKKALQAILEVEPHNKKALAALDKLKDVVPAAKEAKAGTVVQLLTTDDMEGWDPGLKVESWDCSDLLVTCDNRGPRGDLNWYDQLQVKGQYSYSTEFRVVRNGGTKRAYGILFGAEPKSGNTWVLLIEGGNATLTKFADPGNTVNKQKILRKFKPGIWHKVQVDAQPGFLTCRVNDQELFSIKVKDNDALNGVLGLFVQDVKVEIRNPRLKK